MLTRVLVVVGVVVSILVLAYAALHLLLIAGVGYAVNKAYPTPQPSQPVTILPSGYRGIAIICSESAPGAPKPQQTSIHVPDSGVVRATIVPPDHWIYSDSTPVSFTSPPTNDTTSIYATYTEHYVKDVGTVWLICIGTHTQHQTYDPQEPSVFNQFVVRGCLPDFDPPHENLSPFKSTTTPAPSKPPPP